MIPLLCLNECRTMLYQFTREIWDTLSILVRSVCLSSNWKRKDNLEEERHLWRVRRVNNFVIMTEPGWPFSRSTFTRNIHWRAVYLLTRQRFRPFGPLLLPRQRLDCTERHFPVNVSRALLWSRIAQNRFSDGLDFYIQNKY